MGIHYDYKSTRGEKAMKKEAKKKARLEQRRARRAVESKNDADCLLYTSPSPRDV